jgi:hypothetical protein
MDSRQMPPAPRCAATLPAWLGGLALISPPALGGEMAGAPPLSLPSIQPRAELLLSNDAFGRGGEVDDFRTQQLMFSAAVAGRWRLTLDHSVLTLEEQSGLAQGRLDQLSGSLSFELLDRHDRSQRTKVSLGGGFRAYGELQGERIQNGVHRLFDSSIVDVPYVATQRTDLIAWIRGEHLGELRTLGLPQWLGGTWETGYWVHGTTLASTDGQWDSVAGALLTAHKGGFETWVGLRGDWRSGYDRDPVQRFTAENETGLYLTVGLRMGPLLVETNQGFADDAAFGRISLVSGLGPGLAEHHGVPGIGMAFTGSIPDVLAGFQLRADLCGWLNCSQRHRWSAVGDYRFGEPPDGKTVNRFVETRQISAGLEGQFRAAPWPEWIHVYGFAGLGQRQERLIGDGALAGTRSASVGRLAAVGEVGLRLAAVRTERWSMALAFGLTGWLPVSDGHVSFDGQPRRVQDPGIAMVLGATGGFAFDD